MEGAAQTLVSTVGQLVGKEFQQLRGVGRKVAALRDELATMNAILRMQSEADDGSVDHFVREWMKQVRELAYDGEDCVDLYLFRMRVRSSDGLVRRFKRLFETLFRRRHLAGEIQEMRDRAVAISDRHARYGVSRDALRRTPSLTPEPAVRASARTFHRQANESYQVVGMEEQADTLIQRVKAGIDGNGDSDKKLKVFSIVGFGGLGKTTLAIEFCRRLETEFQRQANVSVSQTFEGSNDLQSLLKRILQQIVKAKSDNDKGIKEELTVGTIDTMDLQQLEETLKDTLKDKRYLIVIDDVWAIAAWDLIRSKLPDDNCGSRIMVTTRIETVAKACSDASESGYYIHPIKPLNPQDSEKLFASRAFGSVDAPCPEDLKIQMDEILKKCGGLPLAIVSLGSLLASYNSSGNKHMWERISRSIGSQMESNPTLEGMRQILALSYNHLPYHLKICMMYLSNFPEDYVIDKDRLLNRWIAEGLVPQMRGLTLLEVAEGFFEELMSRSMIDRATDMFNYYDGRVESCRVHDMMLEVMVSKSLEANFIISLIGGQYEGMSYDIDRVRRLSIHGVEEDTPTKKTAAVRGSKRSGTDDMNVQHVRSLSMFELPGHKLLDRLGEFELVRVLDMEGCAVEDKHLGSICRMYLLRFLSLKSTDITEMQLIWKFFPTYVPRC
uniref:Uncharacterized protein n=1 Tax=Avena sativa TaxID=4498 RepID=A0ACD5ZIP9_AVESA